MDTASQCGQLLRRTFIGLLLLSHLAFAQRYQLGGLIGAGAAGAGEVSTGPYVLAGIEGCVLCGGRFGLVFEYTHWQLAGDKDTLIALDLAGGGFRVQGKGKRVRPFFDLVVGGGRACDRETCHSVGGAGIGFGAAISIGERWYVRPQVRAIGVSAGFAAGSFSAAIGKRF